jgi:hypothetical protein
MTSDEPFHICESCRERIDPNAPDTVAANEMTRVETFGSTGEYLEGIGVFFHEGCYPEGSPAYRRKLSA